ncbi:lipoate-protein ligase LplJ [Clostridiales bacterium]|nr:lipoate-protein ligase LplJ [Clostridiales bacterium]
MNKKYYYINNKCTNPYYNLALEEYLLTNKPDKHFIVLWQNENAVIIGRNQNAYEEINTDFISKNHIKVVRRTTGGGAVYHDIGNLNYSFITEFSSRQSSISELTLPIIKALSDIGIQAEVSGKNDITVYGKKVSGTAQRLYKNRILHHGTLLFNSDLEKISGALNVRPEKFLSKSTKSITGRVCNISEHLMENISLEDFWKLIYESLAKHNDIESYSLSEEDISSINMLKEKYVDTLWTFRAVQPMSIHSIAKFEGGLLDVNLKVEQDKITDCKIFGDFMSLTDISPLERTLIGTLFSPAAIKKAVSVLPLKNILGSITAEELVSCIFS